MNDLVSLFAYLKDRTDVNHCCKTGSKFSVSDQGNHVYVGMCGVCGRRHFLMTAEPLALKLSTRDKQLANRPHPAGDGGPPPTRKIILGI